MVRLIHGHRSALRSLIWAALRSIIVSDFARLSGRYMPVDYSALRPGQKVSEQCYVLDDSLVSSYVDAVKDETRLSSSEDGRPLAPPMAVAALSLRGVVQDLAIPGGTLHAGQEIEFRRSVHVGAKLECSATLTQNSVRGGWRFMVVELEVEDGAGRSVMTGKSTIMIPA